MRLVHRVVVFDRVAQRATNVFFSALAPLCRVGAKRYNISKRDFTRYVWRVYIHTDQWVGIYQYISMQGTNAPIVLQTRLGAATYSADLKSN